MGRATRGDQHGQHAVDVPGDQRAAERVLAHAPPREPGRGEALDRAVAVAGRGDAGLADAGRGEARGPGPGGGPRGRARGGRRTGGPQADERLAVGGRRRHAHAPALGQRARARPPGRGDEALLPELAGRGRGRRGARQAARGGPRLGRRRRVLRGRLAGGGPRAPGARAAPRARPHRHAVRRRLPHPARGLVPRRGVRCWGASLDVFDRPLRGVGTLRRPGGRRRHFHGPLRLGIALRTASQRACQPSATVQALLLA
mmetsp:Transcript_108714/g.318053  ORF Transcript_108714/g.318053 Transcript_108714/m.318053 type:complete len:258 (-) Transcript_108714:70-843(-)